jgi:bifunctional non-homologous end joining protein LigD
VLKSWALPKGPSLDPAQKRLAVQVEDHPLEYIDFEGTIPEGEYGAGTVLVWDRGTWRSEDDPLTALSAGMIKFHLQGEKLQGRWMLVRLAPKEGERQISWLLVKERDAHARGQETGVDVLSAQPASVASGRTLLEIAANPSSIWTRGGRVETPKPRRRARVSAAKVPGASAGPLPQKIKPQLASPVSQAPEGEQWLHEIKLDGYRLLAYLNQGQVTLLSRGQQDWTARLPELAAAVKQLPCTTAVLDGELVALLPDGTSSFPALQAAFRTPSATPLVYYAFDLLYLEGMNLFDCKLLDRKELLRRLMAGPDRGPLRFLDHLLGRGDEFSKQCELRGLEGIVSKRADRPHRSGRSDEWKKLKFRPQLDLVIGGFTLRRTGRSSAAASVLGALLLGYFLPDGQLHYVGRVGSGFADKTLDELTSRLRALAQRECPFVDYQAPRREPPPTWVRPTLVARAAFSSWTSDQLLRQASFVGLREDIPAARVTQASVVRDRSSAPVDVTRSAEAPDTSSARRPRSGKAQRASPDATAADADRLPRPLSPGELQQLARLHISHPQRILFPDARITKLDLAMYLAEVSPWMLPQVKDRPLSLVRCPDGVEGECFFQKHERSTVPTHVERIRSDATKLQGDFSLYVHDLTGLASLAQINVVELHVSGARIDLLDRPDRLVFDLDPAPDVSWSTLVEAAWQVRDFLNQLKLQCFVKTSGNKGLHIVVPLQRRHIWAEAKRFAHKVAAHFAQREPRRFTDNMSRAHRRGRIYLDYLRNTAGATTVAAYSPRRRSDAAVSMPVTWDELASLPGPAGFRLNEVRRWLPTRIIDPWAKIAQVRQSITVAAWELLATLLQPRRTR